MMIKNSTKYSPHTGTQPSTYDTAISHLLAPSQLSMDDVSRMLSRAASGVDMADLYFQEVFSESWVLEADIIKEGSYQVNKGVGIRAIKGDKTGFAYSEEIALDNLKKGIEAAQSIAKRGEHPHALRLSTSPFVPSRLVYPAVNPLATFSTDQKIQWLRLVNQYARQMDRRVSQVMVHLGGTYEVVLMVDTSGTLVSDIRPLVSFGISVVVEENGKRESGYYSAGGRADYADYLTEQSAKNCASEAVREALINLEAVHAPAGLMPVVLGPGWPGILLHESIGHGLEGDFNRKRTSIFSDRIGEQVASPLCTIVDDGTLENRRGSINFDDEGMPSQKTVLIENGILKGFLYDKLNAQLMGVKSTGNGRRASYSSVPIPRMTNTYLLPGKDDPKNIIASVKRGLYAKNFSGGQVDITSGKFVFSTSEAYLIENGRITTPVKGATLIGHGPEILKKVSMVGNDLSFDPGIGSCGKDGQSVPVGVGQPTLKIDELTVGGTQI